MPVEAFEVIVGRNGQMTEQVAISSASKYLAYADKTDTFGYHGDVIDVDVYGGEPIDGRGPADSGRPQPDGREFSDYGIRLTFATVITTDDEREAFLSEMENLSFVESVEQVSYSPAEGL